MAQMMLFCVTNSSAEFLLHILGYNVYTEYHILGHIFPNAVAIKSIGNYMHKSRSALAQIILVKLIVSIIQVVIIDF
jgi:hypothetical protein